MVNRQMHRVLLAGLLFLPGLAGAQLEGGEAAVIPKPLQPEWVMPRTEHGHPDLQGTWWFGSRTPLQRPANLGEQRSYTAEEVARLEQRMAQRNADLMAPLAPDRSAPEQGAMIRQEADDNFLAHFQEPEIVPVAGEYRTSVIVDPPNGRIPRRGNFQDFYQRREATGLTATDGPEGQPLSGRCIMFGSAVPSLTPIMMNPNLQIVQNNDYVMIMTEMVHDARIIRLNDEHFDNGVRNWMGDSVGYWEDNTLVVHTRDFRPEQSSMRGFVMSEEFETIERYTLVSDSQIHYAFTVIDPQAYSQPVHGERMLTRNHAEDRIYEFACHEGNYSLESILRGARRQEVEAQLAGETRQ